MDKKTVLTIIVTILITVFVSVPITAVFAEQMGDSPESGAISRIKVIYDSLVTLSHGSDSAGGWGDWGSFWNRIWSAAEWVPDGGLAPEDVLSGETFYSGSRISQTGTGPAPIDFELQILDEWDDYEGPDGSGDPVDDYQGEEAVWTNTFPLAEGKEVWKDERTGLYWSHTLSTSMTNSFPNQDHSTCPFFGGTTDAEKITARQTYDGLTPACGNAINLCGALSLDANNDGIEETNWYLPTQKELLQTYIDGIWNQTNPAFTTTNSFWSSSEVSTSGTGAWHVVLSAALRAYYSKTNPRAVRCVARD